MFVIYVKVSMTKKIVTKTEFLTAVTNAKALMIVWTEIKTEFQMIATTVQM